MTVGALVLAVLALPVGTPGRGPRPPRRHRGRRRCGPSSALGVLVLTYASVSGTPPADPAFGAELGGFLTGFELGRSLLVTVVLAAAGDHGRRGRDRPAQHRPGRRCWPWPALLPIALTGHSGSAEGHETAVTAMGLHLLGISVWVGGLVTLVLLRPVLPRPAAGRRRSAASRASRSPRSSSCPCPGCSTRLDPAVRARRPRLPLRPCSCWPSPPWSPSSSGRLVAPARRRCPRSAAGRAAAFWRLVAGRGPGHGR